MRSCRGARTPRSPHRGRWARTQPYDLPWGPPESFDPATDIGPAWATFYHSATAHAVGGNMGHARLVEIGMPLDAETCSAGVAETYSRLGAMNPTDRAAAFASMDCSDYYFDPAPAASGSQHADR